jgi:hypothetical protein
MEREGFDAVTVLDSQYADIFFCELYIDKNEPAQTYQTWDAVTGVWNDEDIVAGTRLARICSDNVPVHAPVIAGYVASAPTSVMADYEPYPISLVLPTSGTEKVEVVQFVIDNIDRTYVDIMRRLRYPLRVNIARGFVRDRNDKTTSPNQVTDPDITPTALQTARTMGFCSALEQRLLDLVLQDVMTTPERITGKLVVDTILWKKYPNNNEVYEHDNFPGLWGLDDDDMGEDPEFKPPPPGAPPVAPPTAPANYDFEVDLSATGKKTVNIPTNGTVTIRFSLKDVPGNTWTAFLVQTLIPQGSPRGCFTITLPAYGLTTGPPCNSSTLDGSERTPTIATDDHWGPHTWVVPKGVYQYLKVTNTGAPDDCVIHWFLEQAYDSWV